MSSLTVVFKCIFGHIGHSRQHGISAVPRRDSRLPPGLPAQHRHGAHPHVTARPSDCRDTELRTRHTQPPHTHMTREVGEGVLNTGIATGTSARTHASHGLATRVSRVVSRVVSGEVVEENETPRQRSCHLAPRPPAVHPPPAREPRHQEPAARALARSPSRHTHER